MIGIRRDLLASLLCAALSAACGTPSGTDAGNDDVVTPTDGTNMNDGAPNDSSMTLDCATIAQRTCTRIQTCTPLVFDRTYETMALCTATLTQSCTAEQGSTLPEDNGLVDPAGCLSALDNCTAYLASIASASGAVTTPPACVHRRGTRAAGTANASCGADFMCVAGQYCYGITQAPICQDGSCNTPDHLTTGYNTCNTAPRDPCDVDNDQRCLRLYDMTQANRISTDTNGSRYTCRQVTRGGVGDGCAAGTDRQCAAGLVCTAGFTCQPLLGMGMSCDGAAAGQCDTRLGLSCQPVSGSTSSTCRPTPFARTGAQCGTVTEAGVTENRLCASAVAFCNGATPTVCEALRGMGDPCTTSPRDNCRSPFACRSGTCQLPTAPMCN